ncbi:MAG: competence/damage-inducible protein A [Phycisphaerae bacterium]|nr:competence/damage-inducible protein A [Phycisphaerae bacterium]
MSAIILSIGDELVSGLTVNTNATWLSRQLSAMGISTLRQVTVGDDHNGIAAAIREACGQCRLVLISGGLGPTLDDVTRQALAAALDTTLVEDTTALEQLEAFFQRINRPMAPSNRRQALRPQTAQCLPNSCGTAPGLFASTRSTDIFVVPGVPREMQAMFTQSILPRLGQLSQGLITRTYQLNTFGIGESVIGQRIADLMVRGANPSIGTTVHEGVVSVRIYARGSAAQADAMVEDARGKIIQRLGNAIFSQQEQSLEEALAVLLNEYGPTIAVAESCTGGLLAQMLTSVPGASSYFQRGWVTYSDQAKVEELGVPPELLQTHGAVSEPVALAMAQGALCRAASQWALSITGIAGPDGGTAEKPVGLVYIGLAGPGGTTVRRNIFTGDRAGIRRRSAQMAMTILRLNLQGLDVDAVLA